MPHLPPALSTITRQAVFTVLSAKGYAEGRGERVGEGELREETDLATLVDDLLSRLRFRAADPDAWHVLLECEAWREARYSLPGFQRVLRHAQELLDARGSGSTLPELLGMLSGLLLRWPTLASLPEGTGAQLLSLSLGCVTAPCTRCRVTAFQLLRTLLELLEGPLRRQLVSCVFALLLRPRDRQPTEDMHAELLQVCGHLICASDQDTLSLLADKAMRRAVMCSSARPILPYFYSRPALAYASCLLLAVLLAQEAVSGGEDGEDALSALGALHRAMLVLPYALQDADTLFTMLCAHVPASPRSRDTLLCLSAQLLFVLHRCPLSVLPDCPLPPLCPLPLLSEERAMQVLQVLERCVRSECFPRQSLRDALVWLAGLPLLASPPQCALHNAQLATHFAWPGPAPSLPPTPLDCCPPISLNAAPPLSPLWGVFGHLVGLGLGGSGQRSQVPSGGVGLGGLVQSLDYQDLLTRYSYLAVLQQDELAGAPLHGSARCAMLHVLCHPACLSSWGALLARASEAHSLLLDDLASRALPEPSAIFFDAALSACNDSVREGIRAAPLDALLWPMGPPGLRVALPLVEQAFAWIGTQASSELETWFGESHAQDCFLEQLTRTNEGGPVFSDVDAFIRALLLQHVLLRMLQHLLRCIFLLMYAHRDQLEQARWLKAVQLYAVHLNVLRRHGSKTDPRYLCQQTDLLTLYPIGECALGRC
ncbi:hypothetical protein EON64_10895 [archaeon]|nr:MAG: hypothetical protein EON64_10895 [archaeon]